MSLKGEMIRTVSPITNTAILLRPGPTSDELTEILETSTKAFTRFSTSTTLTERIALVLRALELLEANRDELAAELTEFVGRPIKFTAKEIDTALVRARYMVSIARDALQPTPGIEESGFNRFIQKAPLGPVLIVFAWNYPYLILVNSLIPALLAGNSVILKPSPQTPTVAEHIKNVFDSAGLLNGVLQYFHSGSTDLVKQAVQSEHVKLVCFTGSVPAGLAVQQAATEVTKFSPPRVPPRVGLELGGNDPAYVCADMGSSPERIAWVASELVDGAMFNSGQSCCSVERVYVHASLHRAFVEAVVKELRDNYKLGDPRNKDTNLGPVVSSQAAKRINDQVAEAIEQGAVNAMLGATSRETADYGNKSFTAARKGELGPGNYVIPAVLTNVTSKMAVMREETFGPVIPIMSVASDEEAIKLMNESDLGLTASIWTDDIFAGRKLVDQVEAGTVFINRCDFPSADLAWTGWKNSGQGQTLSQFGFDQFYKLKSYHIKVFPKTL